MELWITFKYPYKSSTYVRQNVDNLWIFQNSSFFQQHAAQTSYLVKTLWLRMQNTHIANPPYQAPIFLQNLWNFGILESCSTHTTTTTIYTYICIIYLYGFSHPPETLFLQSTIFCDSKIYSKFQHHFTNNQKTPHFQSILFQQGHHKIVDPYP